MFKSNKHLKAQIADFLQCNMEIIRKHIHL